MRKLEKRECAKDNSGDGLYQYFKKKKKIILVMGNFLRTLFHFIMG